MSCKRNAFMMLIHADQVGSLFLKNDFDIKTSYKEDVFLYYLICQILVLRPNKK